MKVKTFAIKFVKTHAHELTKDIRYCNPVNVRKAFDESISGLTENNKRQLYAMLFANDNQLSRAFLDTVEKHLRSLQDNNVDECPPSVRSKYAFSPRPPLGGPDDGCDRRGIPINV